jgi:hypothetical protein
MNSPNPNSNRAYNQYRRGRKKSKLVRKKSYNTIQVKLLRRIKNCPNTSSLIVNNTIYNASHLDILKHDQLPIKWSLYLL